jgi:hypothetical protein
LARVFFTFVKVIGMWLFWLKLPVPAPGAPGVRTAITVITSLDVSV